MRRQVVEAGEHVAVRDAQLSLGGMHRLGEHRRQHLLEFRHGGRRRAIREDQPVDHEVAVVRLIAEVAAVGEEGVGVQGSGFR